LGVALFSAFWTVSSAPFLGVYRWVILDQKQSRWAVLFFVACSTVPLFVALIAQLHKNEQQQIDYQIWKFISIGLAIWTAYLVLKSRNAWMNNDFYRATTLVLLIIVFVAGAAGRTFGLYVRDVSSYEHEIWKSSSTQNLF